MAGREARPAPKTVRVPARRAERGKHLRQIVPVNLALAVVLGQILGRETPPLPHLPKVGGATTPALRRAGAAAV